MTDKYNRREPPSNAKQSSDSIDSNAITHNIQYLTKNLARTFNHKYQQAKKRNEENPVMELERRVMKKLLPMYSRDRYLELVKVLSMLTPFEKMELLRKIETNLPKRGR